MLAEAAKARFSELVRNGLSGEGVVIARENKPILKLVPLERTRLRRRPGSAKGKVWMAPDFAKTLKDFADYR